MSCVVSLPHCLVTSTRSPAPSRIHSSNQLKRKKKHEGTRGGWGVGYVWVPAAVSQPQRRRASTHGLGALRTAHLGNAATSTRLRVCRFRAASGAGTVQWRCPRRCPPATDGNPCRPADGAPLARKHSVSLMSGALSATGRSMRRLSCPDDSPSRALFLHPSPHCFLRRTPNSNVLSALPARSLLLCCRPLPLLYDTPLPLTNAQRSSPRCRHAPTRTQTRKHTHTHSNTDEFPSRSVLRYRHAPLRLATALRVSS